MKYKEVKMMRNTIAIIISTILLITGCAAGGQESLKKADTLSVQEDHDENSIVIPDENSVKQEESLISVGETAEAPEPATVRIAFAGDIDFDDRYTNMIALRSDSAGMKGRIGESLMKRMKDADIFMLNNEFPYSDRGEPLPDKKFTFRAKPETASFLNEMGVDIVSLANNHAYDYGPDALLDSMDTLREKGIPYVGAGKNIEEAKRPYYFTFGDTTIAFTSATQIERSLPPDTKEATETEPGVLRTLNPASYCECIREAEKNSDFVIAFVHWGSENVHNVEEAQRELARAYVEAGADLIIGAHPHVLQGFEYEGDVPVMYSLGNFWFNSKPLDTCLVEAVIKDKKLESLQFIPCVQQNCRTTLVEKGTAEFSKALSEERSYSYGVNIDEDGFVTKSR
ncbi:MAG: CapA family protein [Lachnospiraceae bacterium]|nr:CapA family protein [Lachnospiraceae bacterium]